MTSADILIKRLFDIAASLTAIVLLWPVIIVCIVAARLDTGSSGIFSQRRIGQNGRPFVTYKIRTMIQSAGTTVTTINDSRISKSGAFMRKHKLDELPQLWNILKGDMSFVGPRPDVEGFADQLAGEDRMILTIKPGITGPATLKYRNEEAILSDQNNPEQYNRDVIWPEKVRINLHYVRNYSFLEDIKIIIKTVL